MTWKKFQNTNLTILLAKSTEKAFARHQHHTYLLFTILDVQLDMFTSHTLNLSLLAHEHKLPYFTFLGNYLISYATMGLIYPLYASLISSL